MAFLVFLPNSAEAVTLTASCSPPSVAQGGSVTCNLSFGIATSEYLPIDKLRVQAGGQKLDFNLAGSATATGNSSAFTMTVTPTQSPSGFGYGGLSGQTLTGFGYGYNPISGVTNNDTFTGGTGFGYGYGYGYQFLQNLNYTVQINTTSFTPGPFSVDFQVFVTGDPTLDRFENQVKPTFTVVAPAEDPGCLAGFALNNGNCVAAVASGGGTVEEILAQVADQVPGVAAKVIDSIVDAKKRAQVLKSLPKTQSTAILKKMNTDKLAEALEELDDDSADIIDDLAEDDEGATKAAAAIEAVAKKSSQKAANVVSKASSKAAAKVLDTVKKKEAGAILTVLPKEKRQEVILQMTLASLTEKLAEVTPAALQELDPKKLMEKLPAAPPSQLGGNTTPKVPAGTPEGKVTQVFGNVAIYEVTSAEGVKSFIWVTLVHSPEPLDQVLAQFTEDVQSVSIIVNVVGTQKPSTAPALPNGLVPSQYFYVTPNVGPEKIKQGLISFFVEKSWLEANGFHKWSVVLQRLNSDTNEWQPIQTQRVSEDETRVHYDAPVPGFSLFAITGGTVPATVEYTVADLQVSPAVVVEGAAVTVTAAITNTSATDQTIPISLSVNQQVDDSQSIAVAAGATETVTFTTTQAIGTYAVRVDRLFGSFTVVAQQVATPTPQPTATPAPTATTAPAPVPTATRAPAPAPTATRAPAPAPTATRAPAPAPTATSAPAPAPTATSAPAPAPTAVATIAPSDDDDGGNLGLIIGIIIVVLVIGGGVAFFALRSRQRA